MVPCRGGVLMWIHRVTTSMGVNCIILGDIRESHDLVHTYSLKQEKVSSLQSNRREKMQETLDPSKSTPNK